MEDFFIKMYGMLPGPGLLLLQLWRAVSSSDSLRYLMKSSLFLQKDDTECQGNGL